MASMRTTVSPKRSGLLAYEESVGRSFPDIVISLRERLGVKLVA